MGAIYQRKTRSSKLFLDLCRYINGFLKGIRHVIHGIFNQSYLQYQQFKLLIMNHPETLRLMKALSFAADKHCFQRRKDTAGTPYINHPIKVALTLLERGKEDNEDLLVAAILHDTIEDTQTTPEEIEEQFGKIVLSLVLEVTDDKNLPKEERKRLQVVHAPHKSTLAKKLKLADKICNVYDILNHPPGNWSIDRKLDYLTWAENILMGLKGTNAELEEYLAQLITQGRKVFQMQ
jgi:guanosine-3',5'-bis(diphosphate) 3'-pyrophosphohydrolase